MIKILNASLNAEYHGPFISLLEMNTWGQRKALEFIPEHPVTKGPLKTDCLVVKKNPYAVIKKAYAMLWRKFNIIEYKSWKAPLNMHVLAQAHTYANAVLYRGTKLEPVNVENLTVTIFRHSYPRKFFKECRTRGWTVEKKYPGVYKVEGFSCIPTQVVVLRLVDDPMLRILVPGARREDIERVLEVISGKKDSYFQQLGRDVLELLWETNGDTLEEIEEAGKMKGSVLELFKHEIDAAETKGGDDRAKETAKRMIRRGKMTLEEIAEDTGLTLPEVEELAGVVMA